jgi:pseudaminic acid biosynthesis-associated methylase
MNYSTAQEGFWAGAFGDAYTGRNRDSKFVATSTALFARILSRTSGIRSALELGANVGLNLLALKTLIPQVQLKAVEINQSAYAQLSKIDGVEAVHGSILDYRPAEPLVDLAFTSGVLIHIHPDRLREAYEVLYAASRRYVLVCEYYNPVPVEVAYRGHAERLFKRDFAGEIMTLFPDLSLLDYGFVYHRDPVFPADDFNWFLMEKR